jgi:ABC-type transport system involved in cytochrome c biogenesis permease subunit
MWRQFVNLITSLKLTIVCLVAAMVLIFAGTLAQVHYGTHVVQERYFQSMFVWWPAESNGLKIPVFPGGHLLGGLLLINLIAAHIRRFRWTWRKLGIHLTHFGLIIMLAGGLFTDLFSVESYLHLGKGDAKNYTEDPRLMELAVIDQTDSKLDKITAIPEARLHTGGTIEHSSLPFRIVVKHFYQNSQVRVVDQSESPGGPVANQGVGARIAVTELPPNTAVDGRDVESAVIQIVPIPTGNEVTTSPLGTWLVSDALGAPQTFSVAGRTWEVALRRARYYKPYSVTLQNFTHERYAGTDIPKNFESRVTLIDPKRSVDRDVLIYMNHPLRYRGETFYQSGFDKNDNASILEVVHNPSFLAPYIACIIVASGLLIQFSFHLIEYSRRRRTARIPLVVENRTRRQRFLPWIIVGLAGVWVASNWRPPTVAPGDFDLATFSKIPVLVGGRLKPLDTVARTSLLVIHGKQQLQLADGKSVGALGWLADVLFNAPVADRYPTFVIQNAEVLGLFGWQQHDQKYFSYDELSPFLKEINDQGQQSANLEAIQRSAYQTAIFNLRNSLALYQRLKISLQPEDARDFAGEIETYLTMMPAALEATKQQEKEQQFDKEKLDLFAQFTHRYRNLADRAYILPIAPTSSGAGQHDEWASVGASLLSAINVGEVNPIVTAYALIGDAYRNGNPALFNQHVQDLAGWMRNHEPEATSRSAYEFLFNQFAPFYQSMALYVLAFMLACVSWLKWSQSLNRAAFYVLLLAFSIHTFGLVSRMYLQERPPVTNLYSSAIFIGWGTVLVGLILERTFRDGIGAACASAIGFVTLIIAHHLAGSGDTLEMLQAVLDTNIWLATHVVVITTGYSAMFLAGMLAILYVIRGVFTRSVTQHSAQSLTRMTYGVICFATLFSFVGTVLGGIWADQSWGRFWGWDPKENGALLIVLWCATILHARWGGYIRQRGMMVMALFGNVVTSFSWFGVNMLGVGLHSYGFMDKAFPWLIGFVISQLALMAVAGLLPLAHWRSFQREPLPRENRPAPAVS